MTLVVDDREQCIRTCEKNTGQKLSVLEELGRLPNWKAAVEQSQSLSKTDRTLLPNTSPIDRMLKPLHRKFWDVKLLQSHLSAQADRLSRQLLGEPNTLLSNAQQLRYGHKGSLSITLSGQYAGTWKNCAFLRCGPLIPAEEDR